MQATHPNPEAKAVKKAAPVAPDPKKYVYNMAGMKAFKCPATAETLVLVNDPKAAQAEAVVSEKSDPKDPVKLNWEKKIAKASKAKTETFTFTLRHSTAPVSTVEVQCCATVEEAVALVGGFFPGCECEQAKPTE